MQGTITCWEIRKYYYDNLLGETMKILFLTALYDPYIGGGAEISNKILIEGLKKKELDIEIITLGENESLEEKEGIKIRRVKFNKILKKYLSSIKEKRKLLFIDKIKITIYKVILYFNILYKLKIEKLITESNADIIHTSGVHLFFPQMWWKIAKKHKIKVIHTLRDPLFLYFRGKNLGKYYSILDIFQKKYYSYYIKNYVDMVHSPSRFMLEKHKKSGFIFKKEIVIYNTVVEMIEKNINIEDKNIDIVYVGGIDNHKGINTLIELKKMSVDLKIVCVGDGKLKEECLKNLIDVTGWLSRKEVYNYIKKSKILILPSEWEEAFGRVLIEGIINGTLVIGSDQGAIPEILGNKDKYIFKAKNVIELYEKVKMILKLTEKEYKEELTIMQSYMRKYSYENHIKDFIKLYKNLLNKE